MPTIKKPKKSQKNNIDRQKRSEVYSTSTWRKLRLAKQMANPLCEVCQMENKTALTEDIHHLVSFTQFTGVERDAVAFDYNNLIAVCKYHHYLLHHGFLKGATTLEEIEQRINNNEETPL